MKHFITFILFYFTVHFCWSQSEFNKIENSNNCIAFNSTNTIHLPNGGGNFAGNLGSFYGLAQAPYKLKLIRSGSFTTNNLQVWVNGQKIDLNILVLIGTNFQFGLSGWTDPNMSGQENLTLEIYSLVGNSLVCQINYTIIIDPPNPPPNPNPNPNPRPGPGPDVAIDDEYLIGDWDGNNVDDLAVRRGGNAILPDISGDAFHDILRYYGRGYSESEYLVGDWNGDGNDDLAIRRFNLILFETNGDPWHDMLWYYGQGNSEDEYLIGDWDGDGDDNLAVRRGKTLLLDIDNDSFHDILREYGNGNLEDEYLVGDWDGDGDDDFAVRRGKSIFFDFNGDSIPDFVRDYGNGNSEDEYLVGDWDGDGDDDIAVRRGRYVLLETNGDAFHDIIRM